MLRVFAEFERAMIRERVLAGIARARDQGTQPGRRRLEDTDAKKVAAIRSARKRGLASGALRGSRGRRWHRAQVDGRGVGWIG